MKPSVYLETTIPSYLTAWPSRDLVRAGQQQSTRDWWATRARFNLFVTRVVLDECLKGDPQAATDRLVALRGIPILVATEQATDLAEALLRDVPLPPRAGVDALHIAIAAVSEVQYRLTWNCRHIANLTLRPCIEATCRAFGCTPPAIGTPQELLDQDHHR